MTNHKKACVIGYPISHSLSPVIHNYWLKKYGIEGSYEAVEVAPENLENFLLNLDKNGYRGCNITIPHKERAFEVLGTPELQNSRNPNLKLRSSEVPEFQEPLPAQVARLMGAVNTIVVDENKNLVATNTDFLGFARNLIENAPEFDYDKSTALILGAGGAGKAIAFALASMQVPALVITNRTREKAEEIKNIMINNFGFPASNIEVIDWEMREEILPHINIVVNTTSLGMVKKEGEKDGRLEGEKDGSLEGQKEINLQSLKPSPLQTINLKTLPPKSLVTDIVYNPLETELLKHARELGHIAVDGLGMLLHQAAPGFEAWFGKKPLVDKGLREAVLSAMANR
ncbi:MAG: shikimate dehydrogenase [Rickettsiales bacterium]|nr:shikimate dehydrogenase [Rickettsiales bacterium]